MKWPGFLVTVLFSVWLWSCSGQRHISYDRVLANKVDTILEEAASQYKLLMSKRPSDRFPKTWFPQTGQYEWSGSGWWCSGFYPGSLLFLFEQTRDTGLYHEALRMLQLLRKEQFNTTTHDLGFMMLCSYGNANRVAPDTAYNRVLLTSARSLSTRFNPVTGCIKSWDSKNPGDFLVIIDNMMNLELLFRATRQSGDSSFYNIAITHANTTMKNHFRRDNSSYHVLNYSVNDGSVKEKRTAQGYSNESAWGRGQAWGLYGYVATYRETGDKTYLDRATGIADFILNHLPADKIPYWDFDAPDIPNALRDASAAAIIASALLELQSYDNKNKNSYVKTAETILKNLASANYRATPGSNGGFILMHGVGHKPNNTEVDVPLTYADYYFIEALIRYKKLIQNHN